MFSDTRIYITATALPEPALKLEYSKFHETQTYLNLSLSHPHNYVRYWVSSWSHF